MIKPNKVKYWFKNWLAEWSYNDVWTCVIVKIIKGDEEVLGKIVYPPTTEPSISLSVQTKNELHHES